MKQFLPEELILPKYFVIWIIVDFNYFVTVVIKLSITAITATRRWKKLSCIEKKYYIAFFTYILSNFTMFYLVCTVSKVYLAKEKEEPSTFFNKKQ